MSELTPATPYGDTIRELVESTGAGGNEVPLVLLGQFERVGSTFYLDHLEKTRLVHNEPYKQLVPKSWPIARDYEGTIVSAETFLRSDTVDPLHKQWLMNFVTSKYQPAQQVVKETNLYFALPTFLELFPQRETQILSRHPLGIIGSFRRNDLFLAWGYEDVVSTLTKQVALDQSPGNDRFREFLKERKSWEERLIWLIGMNTVLLSQNVGADNPEVLGYDDILGLADQRLGTARDESSIFNTKFRKEYDDFHRRFSDEEVEVLTDSAASCGEYIASEFDEDERVLTSKLFGDYFAERRARQVAYAPTSIIRGAEPASTLERNVVPIKETHERFVSGDIVWDTGLVTNEQMADFLDGLIDAGMGKGDMFLYIRPDMPLKRGGRLRVAPSERQIIRSEGYEKYPVYWVTWLGAAAYALSVGKALPSIRAWEQVYDRFDMPAHDVANHSYAHDDVAMSGITTPSGLPTDFFGNLKIWCREWSDETMQNKVTAGISWKHYLHDDFQVKTEKPFLTNSRVIGARLVECATCPPSPPIPADNIVEMMSQLKQRLKTPINGARELGRRNDLLSAMLLDKTACGHLDDPIG